MNPLVLAVPVFNAAEFLTTTLDSLNAQGPHVRWWLQDSASTDRTAEVARAMARPGDVVMTEKDEGQADGLNRAFARMGGQIVGFLNGDDLLAPGTAERVVRFFDENPGVDLLYGRVEWIDREGNVTGEHTGRISSLEDILDIYNVWWNRRQWVQPEVFFRRSLWAKVGGFQNRWRLAFDYDFWLRCFLAGGRVAHDPGVVARFRIHPGQKSSAAERAADEIRSIVSGHLEAGAPLPAEFRARLQANLSYDLYQLGRTTPEGQRRMPFAAALLRNPRWFYSRAVRSRIQSSLAKLLGFRRKTGA
jgi:glycosyltransferase involved in cell wall biosynthesis